MLSPKTRVVLALAVTGLAAFGFGVAVGAAGEPDTSPSALSASPAGRVEVAPASCLAALDAAEQLTHEIVIPALTLFADSFDAAAVYDYGRIEANSGKVEALTERTTPIIEDYNAAADECRAAA